MPSLLYKAVQGAGDFLAQARTRGGSRGTLSEFVIGAPPQFGQPVVSAYTDSYGNITPQRMREVIMKTPTAAACFNAILDFAVGVNIGARNIDPSKKLPTATIRMVEDLLRKPNARQTGRRFRRALMRDLLTFGYAAVEIEHGAGGGVANLYVLDAARVKVDYDEHGNVKGYDELDAHGMPVTGKDGVHGWQDKEIVWFTLDEQTSTLYGTSRVVQLYAAAVLESLMMSFIGARFTDSNIPFGVMDVGDISQEELQFAIEKWNEQVERHGEHRVIITGSKGQSHWYPFAYHLKDLDATNLLKDVRRFITAVLGCTMNELGESDDINKSNGYNLSFTFKKRAIEPLLNEICDSLTSFLLHRNMGLADAELYFEEIDSRDELLQSQIDDLTMKQGVDSINAIRNRKGLPSIPGGDEPCLWTGSAWIPVSQIQAFADAQLQALQLTNLQMMIAAQQAAMGGQTQQAGGAGEAKVSPPITRPMRFPENYTTPDGKGSSTPKLELPKPKLQGQPKQEVNPKRTRGPVQTMRAQGARKEDAA